MGPSSKSFEVSGKRLHVAFVCYYRGEMSFRVDDGRQTFSFDFLPDGSLKFAELRAPWFEKDFGCSFGETAKAVRLFQQEREDADIRDVIRLGGVEYLDADGRERAKLLALA